MSDDYQILGNSSSAVSVPAGAVRIVEMDDMDASLITAESGQTVRSQTPSIYVPRRFRIGGLPGIRHGAAIVGTPQGNGMVAIDVQATEYVDPNPEVWGTWVAEAVELHVGADQEAAETMIVSEHDLIAVGRYEDGCVLVDEVGRARLSMWIEAGRAAYAAEEAPQGHSAFAAEAVRELT